ncbi:uncharacterized protein N7511_008170 [Penicillium nucicola]|uniref:uncharacterized protein n=1 Tax=Penicillium nucicola TaxID=1850975 RepID=UPI0025454258|nr:uncharacterized protein N7511_008170 [Penicillium nucicola]KAJ5754017.1 hypothetical protein N7511_008170 [Penicillium nucicola]
MSITKGHVVEESENVPGIVAPKQSFGARVGAHFKRFWWAHLIFFVICVLVISLPVVYVAYPKIAQDAVNDSTLNITEMVISNPTPDSFQLNQTQVLGSKSPYHPHIYEFDAAVSLAGAAAPFTTVRVPGVKSVDGVQIHVDQMVDLSDTAAFGDYATAVMLNEQVELNIYGTPGLKQGALPKTTVTYNKTVVMKGLNKLEGFAVPDFHILIPSVNGYNMNGTVYIPNPSVMTISMGNLTLNLAVNGKAMGQTYINDLVLKPGNNTIPMLANVDQAAILTMFASTSNPYKDGIVPFTITGNSSVYHGKNLEYFTEALAANKLTVNLNVYQALKEAGLDLSGSS